MKRIFLLILLIGLVGCESHHDEHKHDEHKHEEHSDHDEHEEHEDHEGHDDHDDHDDHGHGHGHGDEKTGEGKAITKVDEKHGFQLSHEAQKRLAIKTTSFEKGFYNIPDSAYVVVGKERALYRKREGFFKLIDEHELTGSFTKGDEIVISGIGLLRVSDIFSTDESEYGHAH
ncbi:hypothetical protein ABMA79_09120 [Halobacteriovorax sp. HFRX-2_2]|uniref:hypothetical protein n=1 Tax=unclassified Halobacteriovorax TaxID=2639665 RepID=UPI0037136D2C